MTSQFTPLDEKEAVDRVQKYAKIKMDLVECSTPKLPTPFKGTFQDITNVLQESHPTSRKVQIPHVQKGEKPSRVARYADHRVVFSVSFDNCSDNRRF